MKIRARHISSALMLCCALQGCANEIPTPIADADASYVDWDMSRGVDMTRDSRPDASPTMNHWPHGLFGSPCDADDDCAAAPDATCARLLGEHAPGVCTIEDCVVGECPAGGQCVALGQTTACLPKTPGFCEVECGDPLECALDLECLERGCCGSGTCPSICGQMSYSDCEMSARCAASCCTL